MHGHGNLRRCLCGGTDPTCLTHLELRGPRNITSANIDRILDDHGHRFLYIEEKRPNEGMTEGQKALLRNLARQRRNTVWIVTGTPDELSVQMLGNKTNGQVTMGTTVYGNWTTLQRLADEWFGDDI